MTRLLFSAAVLAVLAGDVGQAKASLYNFDAIAAGNATTFSDTQGGITATFSSPADPGGFVVAPANTMFTSPFAGNTLYDPGPSGAANIALDVGFNTFLSSVSLNFATDGVGPFTLLAYSGATLVGSTTASGTVPGGGFIFPQGSISFGSATFNNLVLESNNTPYFAVDNISVTAASSSIPEPSDIVVWSLLAAPSIGLVWRRKRKKSA